MTRLWVRIDGRGMGIGEALVAALLKSAKEAGYKRVVLRSHQDMTPAHSIYRRAGFTDLDGYGYFSNFEGIEVAMQQHLG